MTYTDTISNIEAQLELWRNDRHITTEQQIKGLIPNLTEELIEFMRAETEPQMIDALCDIIVLCLNCGKIPDNKLHILDVEIDYFINLRAETKKNTLFYINHNSQYNEQIAEKLMYHIHEIQSTLLFFGDNINHIYHIYGIDEITPIIETAIKYIIYLRYDFQLVMNETIKEISSRTGSYDEAKRKWVKDTSDEARANWYQANYEACKTKQHDINTLTYTGNQQ